MKKLSALVAAATSLLAAPSAFAGAVIIEGSMDGWIIVQVGGLFGA